MAAATAVLREKLRYGFLHTVIIIIIIITVKS